MSCTQFVVPMEKKKVANLLLLTTSAWSFLNRNNFVREKNGGLTERVSKHRKLF